MDHRNGTEDERHGDTATPAFPIDRDGFAALFDRYFRPLAAYARRYTGSEAVACDLVQDVFVKLWEDRETLEVRASMQALLYTMVRNRALNYRRDQRRVQQDVPAEQHAEPVRLDEESELRRILYDWIDELPERRREAFMLSRFHDLSHAEIADVMNVSERTVDTHILLALRSLRERFDRLRQEENPT